jgi:hypothetical protein
MRIVTYNIRGWRTLDGEPNLHQLITVLQAIGGDVVGLNEVFYPRAVAGESRPALTLLAERLGMHYVFGPCLRWPAQDDMPATAYGNAILSRWPIIASAAHHLTSKEEDPQGLLLQRDRWPPACARARWTSTSARGHIIGPGRLLRRAIQADQLSSLIFYGPPGTGKTTLAMVIANSTRATSSPSTPCWPASRRFARRSPRRRSGANLYGQRTTLFVDEVHRWNKAQQDALLAPRGKRHHHPDWGHHGEPVL